MKLSVYIENREIKELVTSIFKAGMGTLKRRLNQGTAGD